VRVLPFDVGEGPWICGWNLYVYDSDFVRPRVFGQLPVQGNLIPQVLWRSYLRLLSLWCPSTASAFRSFWMAKNRFRKDG
jgi:hypothetical protein